jgi:hypothetical protein
MAGIPCLEDEALFVFKILTFLLIFCLVIKVLICLLQKLLLNTRYQRLYPTGLICYQNSGFVPTQGIRTHVLQAVYFSIVTQPIL